MKTCPSARCSLGDRPRINAKRAPTTFARVQNPDSHVAPRADVILNRKIELARASPRGEFRTLSSSSLPIGTRSSGRFGHAQHQRIQFSLNGFHSCLASFSFASNARHIGKQRLNVFTLGLGHGPMRFERAVCASACSASVTRSAHSRRFKLFELARHPE